MLLIYDLKVTSRSWFERDCLEQSMWLARVLYQISGATQIQKSLHMCTPKTCISQHTLAVWSMPAIYYKKKLAVQKRSSWALGFYLTYAPAWFLLWLCSPGLISFHVWHTIPIWHTKPILSTCISSGIITGLWILRHLTAALTMLIALKIYLLVLRWQKYTGLWSFLQDSLQ